MSQKVTAKNLSYSSSIPPFLAKLQAQASSRSGPDVAAAQRRSVKKRSSSEEAEDNPLVVDEDGNTVDVEIDREGTVTERSDERTRTVAAAEAETGESRGRKSDGEFKTVIGTRKRKVGKVVGDAAQPNSGENPERCASSTGEGDRTEAHAEMSTGAKPKKRPKKIKLSFEEG